MEQKNSFVTIPGAIIIAGALVAIAIIYINKPTNVPATPNTSDKAQLSIKPVNKEDHILGNPNAQVKIIEYSDPSCPFCKIFDPTMHQIMDQYGPGGKVAWIYRHFPLDKKGTRQDGGILHPNAGHEAQAMECVASLGGNDKFWAFEKKFYEITPAVTPDSPDGLDQKKLPDIAKSVGVDPVAFNNCLADGRFKEKVESQYTDGINAGISGTPYVIIIAPSGDKIALAGAQSYASMKKIIDTMLGVK